jgi:polyisoprenyl-teichoic acid--peptidoglycan teichoic acid transferase
MATARSRPAGGGAGTAVRPVASRDRAGRLPSAPPRRRPPSRGPMWAQILVILGALLMMGSGSAIICVKYLISRYAGEVDQRKFGGDAAVAHVDIKGEVNLLLVGIDERPDSTEGTRADSIIVLHIPASHDKAYLISIPRDTYVQIPKYKDFRGSREKINAAFLYGGGPAGDGFDLLAQTVHVLTGVKFSGGAVVNFSGFRDIVDALGGVNMYVDEKVTSIHLGRDSSGKVVYPAFTINQDGTVGRQKPGLTPIVYEPGWHKFVGWQALDYCRQRDLLANGDGDYGRQRHQQQFLRAMIKEVTNKGLAKEPVKLDQVLRKTAKAFTFYGQGIKLEDWVFAFRDMDPGQITMVKTNGGRFASQVLGGIGSVEIFTEESQQMFAALRSGDIDDFLLKHPDWVSGDQ